MAGEEVAGAIRSGDVGILPTDTIYGIVGSALDKSVYEKILKLKKRKPSEKFVILAASWSQINGLGVNLSAQQKSRLAEIWPGPSTAVLDAPNAPQHLKAADGTIAIRWPKPHELQRFIEKSGPIIATSVNERGEPFLNSIEQIKEKFAGLDFYVSGKVLDKPSQIVQIFKDGSSKKLR